jgi:putative transposase
MPDASELFRFFDRHASFHVTEGRRLPHWSQEGTVIFITWRAWDSMPRHVLEAWQAERAAWLHQRGIDPNADNMHGQMEKLPYAVRREYQRLLFSRWEGCLDTCFGACVLRRPELAHVVAESLRYFDGDRYLLIDFVVMPNHVHVLAAFPSEEGMRKQCASWKHYTAVRLDQALGVQGKFWASDSYDHLVRGADQFDGLRRYIAENPRRAKLQPGQFIHYSRESL